MANRWWNNGKNDSLFSWAPKPPQMVTAAMKLRHLLLGRKAMTNLDSIWKSRDITLLTKVHIVKAMIFPVVIYRWELDHKEGWALKYWCFKTVVFCFFCFLFFVQVKLGLAIIFFLLFFNLTILYWFCHISRRLLKVPWTARRSNQSILKEINPGYSLEGLMLKLKLRILATWWEELTHWKRPWC